jgi:hypothetical protein
MAVSAVRRLVFFFTRNAFARRALLVRAGILVFARIATVLTKPARQRIVIVGKSSVWPGRATEAEPSGRTLLGCLLFPTTLGRTFLLPSKSPETNQLLHDAH